MWQQNTCDEDWTWRRGTKTCLVTNCKFTTFLSVTNPLILPAPPEIFIVAERTGSDLEISWTHSGVTTSNTRNKPKSPQKSIKSAFRIIKVTRVHNLRMKMVDFAPFTICTWKEASCLREYFAKTISLLYFHQNCQIAEISDYFVNWLLPSLFASVKATHLYLATG